VLHIYRLDNVTVPGAAPREQVVRLLEQVRTLPGYKLVADQLSEFDFRHSGSLAFSVQLRSEAAKTFFLKSYWPTVQTISPAARMSPLILSTGLADLDRVLGGGLLRGSVFGLEGESGTGKTLLALWLAHQFVGQGLRAVVASRLESAAELVRYALGMSVELLPLTKTGQLEFAALEAPAELRVLQERLGSGQIDMLVLDQFEDFVSADRGLPEQLVELRSAARASGGIVLCISGPQAIDVPAERRLDGFMRLELPRGQGSEAPTSRDRTVRVVKNRGLPIHPIECFIHLSTRGVEVAEMSMEVGVRPWQISESLRTALELGIERGAEDIFLLENEPVAYRTSDRLNFEGDVIVSPRALLDLLSQPQRVRFMNDRDVDFSFNFFLSDKSRVRFRTNLHMQRGQLAATIRPVPKRITSFEDLNLPTSVKNLVQLERGLLLVSGQTGGGKSTTIAAILDGILKTRPCHLITIENPIEYEFTGYEGVSLIEQREIFMDSPSFQQAVQGVLRQNPQVILLGELRDPETTDAALALAETGHLVVSSVHAMSAGKAILRVANVFTGERRKQALSQMGVCLTGVVYQRLLPRADGNGIVPACEVVRAPEVFRRALDSPDSNFDAVVDRAIYGGSFAGGTVYRFEESLYSLYQRKLITLETLVAHANKLEWLEARIGEKLTEK
jgi:twitching motility protein PilT